MLDGHDARAARDRRDRAARPRRRHRREGGDRRRDGRLQARVPAVGAHRGRGGVHRRVQHPRRARHDDAGRPGDRVQRPGHPGDRDEPRRQRARPGQPGQLHDRPRRCNSSIRNVGGGRPGEVDRATHGNPGKIGVLLRRERRRLAVRHARRRAAASPPAPTRSRCSPARGRGASSTRLSREPERLARSMAACLQTLHHPKLVLGFDAILVVGPEHARVFAEAGWDRERRAGRASAPACNRPGASWCAARAESPRASPTRSPTCRRCPSSATAGSCSPTPAAAPGCSRRSSAAGPTAPSERRPSRERCNTEPVDRWSTALAEGRTS